MNYLYKVIILLFAAGLAANGASAGDKLRNRELLQKSGYTEVIATIPAQLEQGIDQLRQLGVPVDDRFEQAWGEAIAAYDPDRILAHIDAGLEQVLSANDKKALHDHYDSAFGKRMTALENAAAQPENQAEQQAYARKLLADPGKHRDRLALCRKIDEAVGGTALLVEMVINMQIAGRIGMLNVMKGPRDMDIAAVREELEKARAPLAAQVSKSLQASMAYTYRDVSDDDLNKYLAFLESPGGRKFNAGGLKLFTEVLVIQTEDFGKRLGRSLEREDT